MLIYFVNLFIEYQNKFSIFAKQTIKTNIMTIITTRFFELSISRFNEKELAILHKNKSGFAPLNSKSKILQKAKRRFKSNICDRESFCFSFMTNEDRDELINILNGK